MWNYFKSGALWVTRPARIAYSSRRRDVRGYEPNPVLAVEIAEGIDLGQEQWISSAIAFSAASADMAIVTSDQAQNEGSLSNFLDKHFDKKPSAYLYIGKSPTSEEAASLRLLQIPYRAVTKLKAPEIQTHFPATDDKERTAWHHAFERRAVLYAHFERAEPIQNVLEAYRHARRNFPDLLLVISGVQMKDIPYQPFGLMVMKETKERRHLQYADIMVLQSRVHQPLMSSLANAQIVTQMRNLRQVATEALQHATSVVLYDVRPQSAAGLSELIDSGTMWLVKKNESLGATLSQALGMEEGASTNSRAINRLTQTDNPLFIAIDELIGMERAS